jgi:hypothetical protein
MEEGTKMKMIGVVTELSSASEYTDKQQRATIRVSDEKGGQYGTLRVPNTDKWGLDDHVIITIVGA